MDELATPPGRGKHQARASLTTLANMFGTDKGTTARDGHAYTLVYEGLFEGLRDHPIDLLEVGLSIGGPEHGHDADRKVTDAPSMRLWHEYFSKARMYGVDISDFSHFQTERFSFFRADCGDPEQLERIVSADVALDIVIDDGSHASFHQQLTMLKLFPLVKPGGLYIIEDLNWQPRHYERSLPRAPKTTVQFTNFIASGHFIGTPALPSDMWRPLADEIRSIALFDSDELAGMRRVFNRLGGCVPSQPDYLETPWPRRLFTRAHARRLLETAKATIKIVTGQDERSRCSPVKLAIIRKQ